MPRKKQTDKPPSKESTLSKAADIPELEESPSVEVISRKEAEDMPFGEIIPEMGSGDEIVDVPHFAEEETPISSPTLEKDALDAAIQEARAHSQSVQDQPAHSLAIPQEQPALITFPTREPLPSEIAPPPLIILAATGIMLIFLLTYS